MLKWRPKLERIRGDIDAVLAACALVYELNPSLETHLVQFVDPCVITLLCDQESMQ